MGICRFIVAVGLLATLGTPVLAQEREWMLDVAEEDAFLAFGVPETDDVGVSFWCKIGSGKLRLFVPDGSAELKPNTPASVLFKVGALNVTLQGEAIANDMTGETSVETDLNIDSPLVASLLKEDFFGVTVGKHAMAFPLTDADLAALLKLCRLK